MSAAPGASPRRRTIGESFSGRHNSLNALRLALALMVLVGHAGGLGGFGDVGGINGAGLGTFAVYGFFGISGFLIAGSAVRNRPGRYIWQRFLRIFPAFWVCLIVTALFFGILGWMGHHPAQCGLSCYFGASDSPLGYLYRNWFLPSAYIQQSAIAGTPSGIPLPLSWDGSLWTLFYEFLCYLGLMALAVSGCLRHRIVTLVGTVGLWALIVLITLTPSLDDQFNAVRNAVIMSLFKFAAVFLVGAVIYLYRDRIPDSGWLALGCSVVFVASLWLPNGTLPDGSARDPLLWFTDSDLLAPLVAYPLLWLGIHLPFQRVSARNDYSYGVYIYAYPVSQLLAIWGVQRWGYPAYVSLSVVATIPFAVASWWLIEKRALSLKKLELKSLPPRIRGIDRQAARSVRDGVPDGVPLESEKASTDSPIGTSTAAIPSRQGE